MPLNRRFQLGDLLLHRGDCRRHLAALLSADLILTDPPYGINLSETFNRKNRANLGGKIVGDGNTLLGRQVLTRCAAANKPTVAFASPMKPWPGKWRQFLVWDKGLAVGGGGDRATCWKPTWELIQIARTGPLAGNRDSAVLRFPMQAADYVYHPASKSVELLCYLLLKLTRPGELVADPFVGGGATAVACLFTGRRFVGCEIAPEHFKTAVERITTEAGRVVPGLPRGAVLFG